MSNLLSFADASAPDAPVVADESGNASLRTDTDSTVHVEDALSENFREILAGRERRIAELERALKEAVELTKAGILTVRNIRLSCEETAAGMARLAALEKNARNLDDTRIQELLEIMEDVEEGVGRIYQTRRWRIANIVYWIRGLFYPRKRRPGRGYWRIDAKLAEYHTWRDRYFRQKP